LSVPAFLGESLAGGGRGEAPPFLEAGDSVAGVSSCASETRLLFPLLVLPLAGVSGGAGEGARFEAETGDEVEVGVGDEIGAGVGDEGEAGVGAGAAVENEEEGGGGGGEEGFLPFPFFFSLCSFFGPSGS